MHHNIIKIANKAYIQRHIYLKVIIESFKSARKVIENYQILIRVVALAQDLSVMAGGLC